MALFDNRDKLVKYLTKNRIEVKIHYPIPLHLQKASKIYNYKKGNFSVSEEQAKKLITIPVHQFLKKKDTDYILKCINNFYKLNYI